jgi:hypothetical protein
MSPQILNTHHKIIDNMLIKWEKFQKSTRSVTQCHKCQRYGHSAVNCGHKYRKIVSEQTEKDQLNVSIAKVITQQIAEHVRPKKFESTPAPWLSSHSTNLTPVNPSQ